MGPINHLLLYMLVITDAGTNWIIPKISITIGHRISAKYNLGEVGNISLSAVCLGFIATIALYILKCWLNFCAPEESQLHPHVIWVIYAVNFLWIIGSLIYLLMINANPVNYQGNFLDTAVGFVLGVFLFIALKAIGYSDLKDYIPEEKMDF